MKLFSCWNCGVVLDADKICWPDLSRVLPTATNSVWDGDRYVPVLHCPVCTQFTLRDPKFD